MLCLGGVTAHAASSSIGADGQLLVLLKQRRFERLDQILDSAQRDYEVDPLRVTGISRGFAAFARPDEMLRAAFDDWVLRMPHSAYARLARGMYLRSLGWKMRGTRYWREIPPARRTAMNLQFLQALRDAHAALEISPRLMPGYLVLIDIAMLYGERKTMQGLFEDAMHIDPLNYDVRAAYFSALDPKWGGSPAAMAAFIEDTRPFYKRNPSLRLIEAGLLQNRGIGYFLAKRHQEAVTELTKAIDIDPNAHAAREYRGLAYQALDRYEAAYADYKYSAERGVANAKYRLGWLYLYGLGIPRDHRQAAHWLGEAAAAGVVAAKSAYAALLWEGDTLPQDKARARKWWREAAAQGDVYARDRLARSEDEKK